jgi:hypothetical protein
MIPVEFNKYFLCIFTIAASLDSLQVNLINAKIVI